jgi:hypothetical protein
MYVNRIMAPVELLQEWGDQGIKENGGGGEFEYVIFDIL